MAKKKRLIPEAHCINVLLWRDPSHVDLGKWKEYDHGMSAMETGANTVKAAMKIVEAGLKSDYTHFVLSYPIAKHSVVTRGNPHSLSFHHRPKNPGVLEAIKQAMAEQGTKKLDVSLALRVHPSQITRWLDPKVNVSFQSLEKLAASVGLKITVCPIST